MKKGLNESDMSWEETVMKKIYKCVALLLSTCLFFCLTACDAGGKDTPARISDDRFFISEELYDTFGSPQLSNYLHQGSLLADITIESWLRDDDYKADRDEMGMYTYYKARVNKVYKGDQSLIGKTIQYAQLGVEEHVLDMLPGKGDRMLAFLTDSNNADNNTYTLVGYNQGIFTILEYQDVAYAIKQYGKFDDLSDLEVDLDLRIELIKHMYTEGGYPSARRNVFMNEDKMDPQAFVLKDLESRIAEALEDA